MGPIILLASVGRRLSSFVTLPAGGRAADTPRRAINVTFR